MLSNEVVLKVETKRDVGFPGITGKEPVITFRRQAG